MPMRDHVVDLRPILDLYDECSYEDAVVLARKMLTDTSDPAMKVLLKALVLHIEGYSRWDSSYDYSMARSLLKEADEVISSGMSSVDVVDQRVLRALSTLNDVLSAAVDLENALISTDAEGMNQTAQRLENTSAQGLSYLKDTENHENVLGDWLRDQLVSWKFYGAGAAAYGRAMAAYRTDRFEQVLKESEKVIEESLKYHEEDEDEDSYTELASYLAFLRKHADLKRQHPNYLVLKSNHLTWSFSFWVEHECLNKIYDLLLEDSSEFVKRMEELGIHAEAVDEDSLSDLFETVLGADRMRDLVIPMQPLKLLFRGKEITMKTTLRLYRYGIGTIYFETNEDELTVSDLRVYLSFNGPHSAEYRIQWEEKPYCYLHTVAEEIVNALDKVFQVLDPDAVVRFVSHLNWYAYTLARRGIWSRGDGEDRVLTLEDASKYPDFKGLVLGQMEARAALDDWVSRDPLDTKNLAPIRSHTTDLLITTENHGVLSFPDDPNWIVVQYQETLETAVRLRCLITTLIDIAGELLTTFVDETADLAKELNHLDLEVAEKRITATRSKLLPVIHFDTLAHMNIELIHGTLTSNYRDHAELLRQVMDDLNVGPMVQFLERRLGILSHHQTLFSDIAAGVIDRRTKEKEKRDAELDDRRTKAMEYMEVFISVLAVGEVISVVFDALRAPPLSFTIGEIYQTVTYFVAVFVMFAFIFYIRRTVRIKDEEETPADEKLNLRMERH